MSKIFLCVSWKLNQEEACNGSIFCNGEHGKSMSGNVFFHIIFCIDHKPVFSFHGVVGCVHNMQNRRKIFHVSCSKGKVHKFSPIFFRSA